MDQFFSDIEELIAAVESKIPIILENDVKPVAEEIFKKHIKSDIYDVYTPKTNGWVARDGHRITYARRHVLEDSVKSTVQGSNTLLVTSTASAAPSVLPNYSFSNGYDGAFLKLLESGNMGLWRGGFSRPAVRNTQNDFDSSSKIESAIRAGIKREIES